MTEHSMLSKEVQRELVGPRRWEVIGGHAPYKGSADTPPGDLVALVVRWVAGETVETVAAAYGVPKGLVARCVRRASRGEFDQIECPGVTP